AASTSFTSPNGFVFDPSWGGIGAGELVQGTSNAFDGLNQLLVGGTAFDPSFPVGSPFSVVTASAGSGFQAATSSVSLTPVDTGLSLSVNLTSAETIQLNAALDLISPAPNLGATTLRFEVDGVPVGLP